MTIWCNLCKCHVSTPCTSHHLPADHRSPVCRRFRSTKGASKARRDHINHEIKNMRALLPITLEDQERLSYLHSMAVICTYIRKSVLFQGLPAGERSHCSLPHEVFLQALHGFILVSTAQGRLVYVSENVAEYLGVSMVDVLQGDTIYDMVEHSDVDIVKSNLDIENNSMSERSFICCMKTSKTFKLQHGSCSSILVRGSFQFFPQPYACSPTTTTTEPLFVALCTPTVNCLRSTDSHFCHSFNSTHGLDMSFMKLSDSVSPLLGYSAEEMIGRSWYSLVHPDDLSLSADSHRSLMHSDDGFQVEMVLRFQRMDLSWCWIYSRATKVSGECQTISCTNFIISETEARFLQKKISSMAFKPAFLPNSYHCAQHPQSSNNKRQRTPNSQSEEPGARDTRESEHDTDCVVSGSSPSSPALLGDSPAVFIPPYSPASSSSSLQQEELSHDILMDVHVCTDQWLCTPEASPSHYSYPETGLTCHRSPSDSLPAATQTFDQPSFGTLSGHTPPTSSSPSCDFRDYTSDARLVPDCLSVSDMCESPADCALHPDDFGLLLQPQEGSVVQLHHDAPDLPTHTSVFNPSQSPTSLEPNQYSESEQVEISILAQQISSLASRFDRHHTVNPYQHVVQTTATNTMPSACDWPPNSPPPSVRLPNPALVLDVAMFDSFMKDLNMFTRKSSTLSDTNYQQGLVCSRNRHHPHQEQQEHIGFIAEELLAAEHFTVGSIAIDPISMQLGRHEQTTGLLQHHLY
ncbi:neuronal PAS domain-containing protein 4-like [Pelmatolapia mariae]|uniref:neuronal PAS domain-containing protein 4-like n=1 Tax=Pelmatolapia mariae TaxID=158779 RepID=UPI002FE5ED13